MKIRKMAAASAVALTISTPLVAHADCVINARTKTQYRILDSHTVLLSGGVGSEILIKTFSFFSPGSQVSVLKDSFCDYESSVLYIDGEAADAQQVKNLN